MCEVLREHVIVRLCSCWKEEEEERKKVTEIMNSRVRVGALEAPALRCVLEL